LIVSLKHSFALLYLLCLLAAKAGCPQSLITSLFGNPVLYNDWLWAGTFSLAVSSTYLHAQEFQDMKDVLVTCLARFAQYVAGVGISGGHRWL
jgi:hypothetical protein